MSYSLLNADGLILARDVASDEDERRRLLRDARRGALVRIRRGAYVEADRWASLSSREKHLLRIRAVNLAAGAPVTLARESAAAVWGMPIRADYPDRVTVLVSWPGGGSTEADVVRTADGFASARVVEVDGYRVTSMARTALDVARFAEFPDAVGTLDWCLREKNPLAISREELRDEFLLWNPRVGRRQLRRATEFATPLSDSFGESQARAEMEQLGFERPIQQAEFRDELGKMFTDFYWPSVNIAAEFDGFVKYSSHEFTGGDPAAVVWKEKQREDRLRRQVSTVVRIIRSDVARPERLAKLLLDAGVPRGR